MSRYFVRSTCAHAIAARGSTSKNVWGHMLPLCADVYYNDEYGDDGEDDVLSKSEQIFDFLHV